VRLDDVESETNEAVASGLAIERRVTVSWVITPSMVDARTESPSFSVSIRTDAPLDIVTVALEGKHGLESNGLAAQSIIDVGPHCRLSFGSGNASLEHVHEFSSPPQN